MKFSCCLFLLFSPLLFAQDEERTYAWPLTIDNGFSSGFQEFRASHFHAGIDLRTFQQTGYPVLAVGDGAVIQIKVVKNDTGKALYLRLTDGRTVAYFHLERYNDEIEKAVSRIRQARREKYFGDYIFPDPLPVKRGEIIAFSGETGAGFAHLHLEIRDERGFALNPFPLIRFPGRDFSPPVIAGVLVRTRGNSLINGRCGEFYLPMKGRGGTIEEPLIIHGPFDASVNAYDIADTGKVVGPYAVEADLDGHPLFQIVFDRFQRDDNNQLGMVYDMGDSSPGKYLFNLFRQPGFALERANVNQDQAFSSLAEGRHSLGVLVRDHFQNTAKTAVPLIRVREPVMEAELVPHPKGEVRVRFTQLDVNPDSQLAFDLVDDGYRVRRIGTLDVRPALEAKSVILRFSSAENPRFLDISAVHEEQEYFRKRVPFPGAVWEFPSDLVYSVYAHRNELVIRLPDFRLPASCIRLKVVQGDQSIDVKPREEREGIGFSFQPLNRQSPVHLKFMLFDHGTQIAEIVKTIHLVSLRDSVAQSFQLGNFAAEFAPRSVYEPKVLVARQEALTEKEAGFPVMDLPVSLSPFEFPFLDTVWVGYRHRERVQRPDQVGMFRYHRQTRDWHYVRTSMEEGNGLFFKTRIISPGIFALLRDIYPPEIYIERLSSRYRKILKVLIVKIRERGKGVDENSLRVELNGRRLDCEYDPDWAHVKIDDLEGLSAGTNRLRVDVSDLAGNRAVKIFYFRLK